MIIVVPTIGQIASALLVSTQKAGKILRAINLCAKHGVPVHHREGAMWDGMTIRLAIEYLNITHDLAHWVLAPPKRRAMPEFGLGTGPNTPLEAFGTVRRTMSSRSREFEESMAQMLGSLLARKAGLNWVMDLSNADYLTKQLRWDAPHIVIKALLGLLRRGLVTSRGRVTYPPVRPTRKIKVRTAQRLASSILRAVRKVEGT